MIINLAQRQEIIDELEKIRDEQDNEGYWSNVFEHFDNVVNMLNAALSPINKIYYTNHKEDFVESFNKQSPEEITELMNSYSQTKQKVMDLFRKVIDIVQLLSFTEDGVVTRSGLKLTSFKYTDQIDDSHYKVDFCKELAFFTTCLNLTKEAYNMKMNPQITPID